jgi:hypothetical protein
MARSEASSACAPAISISSAAFGTPFRFVRCSNVRLMLHVATRRRVTSCLTCTQHVAMPSPEVDATRLLGWESSPGLLQCCTRLVALTPDSTLISFYFLSPEFMR